MGSGAAWVAVLCLASSWLQASGDGHIRWDLYHKSDAILDFFKKTALKLPTRVRYAQCCSSQMYSFPPSKCGPSLNP